MSNPTIRVIRPGDTSKTDPFTIAVVANPALERYWNSGNFVTDPITSNQPAFDACVTYIEQSVFGLLPGQAERFLSDPAIGPKIRMVSVFDATLPAEDANSLVAEDDPDSSHILVPRRTRFSALLARYGVVADVAYAVSQSPTHTRAAAYFTSDDDASPGTAFLIDGVTMFHRDRCLIPGTVGIHATATSLTALHEFGHALSSYTNGKVEDLYVDSPPGLNCRTGRPIRPVFATYDGTAMTSDLTRDSIGYDPAWSSYHCELHDPLKPAAMDNYWLGAPPEAAQHDVITRKFLLDRVLSKTKR